MTEDKAPLILPTSNLPPRERRPSSSRMRGGGYSRMLCSPYFVVAALLLLSVVSMKYWTLSWLNEDLEKRLETLQIQIKSESYTLKTLKQKVEEKDAAAKECAGSTSRLQQSVDELERKVKERSDEVSGMQREQAKCDSDLTKARRDLSSCQEGAHDSKADVDTKHKADLARKESEAAELRKRVEQLQGEVNSLKAQERKPEPHVREGEKVGIGEIHKPGPGELEDVDPSKVDVREKAVQGMEFHTDPSGRYLPLLPPGDPSKPRKRARFSVGDRKDVFQKRGVKKVDGNHDNNNDDDFLDTKDVPVERLPEQPKKQQGEAHQPLEDHKLQPDNRKTPVEEGETDDGKNYDDFLEKKNAEKLPEEQQDHRKPMDDDTEVDFPDKERMPEELKPKPLEEPKQQQQQVPKPLEEPKKLGGKNDDALDEKHRDVKAHDEKSHDTGVDKDVGKGGKKVGAKVKDAVKEKLGEKVLDEGKEEVEEEDKLDTRRVGNPDAGEADDGENNDEDQDPNGGLERPEEEDEQEAKRNGDLAGKRMNVDEEEPDEPLDQAPLPAIKKE